MFLVADSGSTKTSWLLTDSTTAENGKLFYTLGYNPHFIAPDDIAADLQRTLVPQLGDDINTVDAVYFYGAGCSTVDDCNLVKGAIAKIFPNAYIEVDHDLLAAARALCGHKPGIACILGTGSNSCLYDGKTITDNVTALGFTLGDEGGGAELGRRLMKAYFYRELPKELKDKFDEKYHLSKDTLIHNVYHEPLPNRYIASFSVFCGENVGHPFMRQLVKGNLSDYVSRQVTKYEGAFDLPINFVGSVADNFKDILLEVLAENKLQLGIVIRQPVYNLAKFHAEGASA